MRIGFRALAAALVATLIALIASRRAPGKADVPYGTVSGGGKAPNTIYPAATDFSDSLANTAQIIDGITATRVNCGGRLRVAVPPGSTSVVVWLASNDQNETSGFDVSVPVYIDGAYSTSLAPSTNGLTSFTIALDGSAHTVELWNGYEVYLQGTYIYAVQGVGISLLAPQTATTKLVIYGDSIAVGGRASPPGQLSWFARLRAIFPGQVAQEAFGGRQLWDDSGSGSGQLGFATQAALASRLAGLGAGASTLYIWVAIGINDVGIHHWDAATFGTHYASLLDAIHAAAPSARVVAQSMLITSVLEGTAPAWRKQIQTAAAARSSWCKFVDGTTLMNASGLGSDGLHPSNAGHQAIALGTGAAAGSTSIRAVLGI